MFRTTLVNLSPDGAQASPDFGTRSAGELSPQEVRALLERFRDLDAATNAKADPEILFETRRHKHIVRTGQNRLYLYDPRDVLAPGLVLSVDEILAELDGSAAAARTRVPFSASAAPFPIDDVPVAPPPPLRTALRVSHRLTLAAVSLGCGAYLGVTALAPAPTAPATGFERVTSDEEIARYRGDLAGVYMTGSQPGAHGVALGEDGTWKLFQLNLTGTPSLLMGTYQVGRVDGQLSVVGSTGELPARVVNGTTLSFGGETYARLQ